MPAPRYQFTSHWRLDAPARTVFDILYDVDKYPQWWPQFVKVTPLGANMHDMTLQSFMRYRINYTLVNQKIDEKSLILEAAVDGDIKGTVRWDIDPAPGGGCVAHFVQRVSGRMALLNMFSWVLRPVFRANHYRVMRAGERGLRMHLAALPKTDPTPSTGPI